LVDVDGDAAVIGEGSIGGEAGLGELELVVEVAVGGGRDVIAAAEVWIVKFLEDGDRVGSAVGV
jgi:hypothetical protein